MTTRTIPLPFEVQLVLKSDGTPSRKQSTEAFQAAFDAYEAVRKQDGDSIKQHLDAVFGSLPSGIDTIKVGALRNLILSRMGADASNFDQMAERYDANVGDYITTSKSGAKLATPEEVQASRLAREAAKQARAERKASNGSATA